MKVLITGATGNIGREVLLQLLDRPNITSVVALSRRDILSSSLPNDGNGKFANVIVKDFGNWEPIIDDIKDADAIFWAMGTNDPSPGPNKDWPLAFQTAMLQAWKSSSTPHARRFRCVLLSGRFVVQDQNASLWFLSETRKLKGRYEIAALSFAAQHKDTWATYIPKPGGVITPNVASSWWARSILSTLAGSWGIKSDELAAFVTELIAAEVEEEEEGMISNERLLARGRALLMEKQKKTS